MPALLAFATAASAQAPAPLAGTPFQAGFNKCDPDGDPNDCLNNPPPATLQRSCDANGTSTVRYAISGRMGTRGGPVPAYPGTFTETGTIRLGPQTGPPVSDAAGGSDNFPTGRVLSWEATFIITSSNGRITGSKSLAPDNPASYGVCEDLNDEFAPGRPGARVTGYVAGANAKLTYAATITRGATTVDELGSIRSDVRESFRRCCPAGGAAFTQVTSDVGFYSGTYGNATGRPGDTGAFVAPPREARTVNLAVSEGRVTVRERGSGRFVTLRDPDQVPVGSEIDTTRGTVTLVSAAAGGGTQQAEFFDGRFVVGQRRGTRGLTEARLSGPLTGCKGSGRAAARGRRRVWSRVRGRFGSRGRGGAAITRGTTWLTEDRCEGTLFRVTEGSISVQDFARRRTVTVKAPRTYLARLQKRAG